MNADRRDYLQRSKIRRLIIHLKTIQGVLDKKETQRFYKRNTES